MTNQTVEGDAGYGIDIPEPGPTTPDDYVEGYEMEPQQEDPDSESGLMATFSGAELIGTIVVLLSVVAIYAGFRRRV
ncbi:hypothetical protein [Methanosalsum natronophilum]|uniref:hypothetical protein n=1 Tax=Methanosalsum natronophilum TaxID=768733 RepID=UPI0021697757|nr:hypothetical protein [Methanosalsum natronophilum]MCS3924676.1 cobalamin biosynthesis Mg chelatase CobN [Methanosalsum natronophilum]